MKDKDKAEDDLNRESETKTECSCFGKSFLWWQVWTNCETQLSSSLPLHTESSCTDLHSLSQHSQSCLSWCGLTQALALMIMARTRGQHSSHHYHESHESTSWSQWGQCFMARLDYYLPWQVTKNWTHNSVASTSQHQLHQLHQVCLEFVLLESVSPGSHAADPGHHLPGLLGDIHTIIPHTDYSESSSSNIISDMKIKSWQNIGRYLRQSVWVGGLRVWDKTPGSCYVLEELVELIKPTLPLALLITLSGTVLDNVWDCSTVTWCGDQSWSLIPQHSSDTSNNNMFYARLNNLRSVLKDLRKMMMF